VEAVSELRFTRDETADVDPASLLPDPERYIVRREPLDPHWEWVEVAEFGKPGPEYIRGRCNHLEVVPVESVEGDVVAHLCVTCDKQLPGAPD
jgi:hypothetical protein